MEPETFLLIIAAILIAIDIALLSRPKVKLKQSIYGFYASFIGFALIVLAYLSFVAGFLTSDFSLKQVYSYSSSSMPMLSKFYAAWAGSAGSILLLILFTAITWFSFRAHGYKKQNKKNHYTSIILGIIVVFFLVASVMMNPFSRYGAEGPIEGRGLNPALQSVWMAIHPPIIFAGYAFVVLAFALTLAKMKTRQTDYERLFNFSIKAGWLFLTLGIGLGGLWAYEVLGWGGYWSWDPIETASLLPWVALTIFAIMQPLYNSSKSLASEFVILLAFSSLMFLSALTRGGLLQSVHAYGLSAAGPFILLFAGAMIAYFFYLKRTAAKALFRIDFDKKSLKSWSLGLAIFSLIGIFLVCFSGIVYSMIVQIFDTNAVVPGISFYNYANFPFVIGLFFALIGYGVHEKLTPKLFVVVIMVTLLCSVSLTLISWPTNNILANAGLPLIMAALIVGLLRLPLAVRFHAKYPVSRTLIEIGLVVILLGVFISSTSKQVTLVSDAKLGTAFQASGLTITLSQCNSCTDNSTIQLSQGIFPQSSSLQIETNVIDGTNSYDKQLFVFLYSAYGFVSQPTIIRTGLDDIYIHVNGDQDVYNSLLNTLASNSSIPETFTVNVEKVPFINIIWIGLAIMLTGGVIDTISGLNYTRAHRKQR